MKKILSKMAGILTVFMSWNLILVNAEDVDEKDSPVEKEKTVGEELANKKSYADEAGDDDDDDDFDEADDENGEPQVSEEQIKKMMEYHSKTPPYVNQEITKFDDTYTAAQRKDRVKLCLHASRALLMNGPAGQEAASKLQKSMGKEGESLPQPIIQDILTSAMLQGCYELQMTPSEVKTMVRLGEIQFEKQEYTDFMQYLASLQSFWEDDDGKPKTISVPMFQLVQRVIAEEQSAMQRKAYAKKKGQQQGQQSVLSQPLSFGKMGDSLFTVFVIIGFALLSYFGITHLKGTKSNQNLSQKKAKQQKLEKKKK